ncbi:MAG TPA: HAD family hydrolase [Thermomicrobiales bacterium]|nr:HAD family hydrolase [Thermomicrobiales bacterium]
MERAYPRLAGVLLDVGGTLWPERWPDPAGDAALRVTRLREVLPALDATRGAALVADLERRAATLGGATTQDTGALIGDALRAAGLPDADPEAVRAAICLPAPGRVDFFPGARDLLAALRDRGLGVAIVSNAVWRGGADYARDFAGLGATGAVAAFVSSVDVGYRKPHRALFAAALAALGRGSGACAMVGNAEANDVAPALALGLRAIRVAIEEPRPAASAAHAVATSLAEVAAVVDELMAES